MLGLGGFLGFNGYLLSRGVTVEKVLISTDKKIEKVNKMAKKVRDAHKNRY